MAPPPIADEPAPPAAPRDAPQTRRSEHLIELPGAGGWALWRWVLLRGAGFPARLVLKLAAPESAKALDRKIFEGELGRISQAIREIARTDRFREALLWQNRAALHTGIDALLRRPILTANSYTRRKEALVAKYLQRYCTKCETIGFFGPVAWAEFDLEARPIALRAGPELVRERRVHFEYWAMSALADSLARQPEIRPWAAPRALPLLSPGDQDRPRDRVLKACDGRLGARELARKLLQDASLGFKRAEEVYALLEELARESLILWTFEIPPGRLYPERALRDLIMQIGDPEARARALAALDPMEAGRRTVAEAAGDPRRLDPALSRLEATFTRHTGLAATRHAGLHYAGRTLVFEDCRRDLDLKLGPEILRGIASPLALILQSARWYTLRAASLYRELFTNAYRILRAETGAPRVNYLLFHERVAQQLSAARKGQPAQPVLREVVEEFQERWSRILQIRPEDRSVSRSAQDLHARVRETFPGPHPGWPEARHAGFDLMIAARDTGAIARGDYQAVLSDFHIGFNPLLQSVLLDYHPSLRDVRQACEAEIGPIPILLGSKQDLGTRGILATLSHGDFAIPLADAQTWLPRERVLPPEELVVEERGGRLVVAAPKVAFEVIEFFQRSIKEASASPFSLRPRWTHVPRVTIDDLVVLRESWVFPAPEIPSPKSADRFDRFAQVRRWAKTANLPRFLFATIPGEPKPFYVDLESPVYAEIFVQAAQRGSEVLLTEMMPALDDCWLRDGAGQAYASELRLVALDPEPWRPPRIPLRPRGTLAR